MCNEREKPTTNHIDEPIEVQNYPSFNKELTRIYFELIRKTLKDHNTEPDGLGKHQDFHPLCSNNLPTHCPSTLPSTYKVRKRRPFLRFTRSSFQSNLVYTTPSILRHIFARPNFVRFKTPSFTRPRHSIMRHLESMFCRIKEVFNAEIPFIYVMYI